jgi:hypothetical protein
MLVVRGGSSQESNSRAIKADPTDMMSRWHDAVEAVQVFRQHPSVDLFVDV